MRRIQLPFKGIQRNSPINDGCHDMINLRPKDGAWRPVGQKNDVALSDTGDRQTRHIHKINDTYEAHWFAYSSTIYYRIITNGTPAGSMVSSTYTYTSASQVKFASLGNVLLILHGEDEEIYTFLFLPDSGTYRKVGAMLPDLVAATITQNSDGWSSAVLSELAAVDYTGWTAVENEELDAALSALHATCLKSGYWQNQVYFRYAYELFDGSIVKHSPPIRLSGGYFANWADASSPTEYRTSLDCVTADFQITDANLSSIKTAYKGIIKSVNIYMSRPRPHWESAEVVNPASTIQITQNDTYLQDVDNYYLMRKFNLEELDTNSHDIINGEDITDITVKETMPIDNLTHISIFSETPFVYNQRLFFSNIKNTLPSPFNPDMCNPDDDGSGTTVQLRFEVTIQTEQGEKIVTSSISSQIQLGTIEGTLDCFAYPDRRATKLRVLVYYSSTYYYDTDVVLTPHPIFNFAYAEDIDWSDDTGSVSLQTVDDEYWDYNRIQASEIFNPYYYPAANSYRVGSGAVVGLGANAMAISEGQFGAFPIYAFTEDGVWMLEIGGDDVLIQSVKPFSRHVCNNSESIMSILGGVLFSTNKGLFIISGPNIQEISVQAEGDQTSPLSAVLTKPYTSNDLLSYLAGGVKYGYDYINNEIIVSDDTYTSSWVYSVDTGMWFTIGQSWDRFVHDFPKMWGYLDDASLRYDLTVEDDPDDVRIQLETRPLNLGGEGYKKILRAILEAELFPADADQIDIKVYGSCDRGTTWGLAMSASIVQSVDGNTREIVLSRSLFSAHKFIIVIDGDAEMDTTITGFIADVEDKMQRKLR